MVSQHALQQVSGGVVSKRALQGGACSGGCLLGGGVPARGGVVVETPPGSRRPLLRTVRILLECILVRNSTSSIFSTLIENICLLRE